MTLKLNQPGILKSVDAETQGGEIIGKRASILYYITDGYSIGEVADVFSANGSLRAIGVTGEDGRVAGLVMRNDLLSLIGQKFGRELYLGRNIREFITGAEIIYYRRSTFSVIEEFTGELRSVEGRYFILADAGGVFRGIVSTFDLVLFLSEMMTRELKAARRIHSAIVRDEAVIDNGRISVHGSMVMAGESGGDFLHVRSTGDNRWFISLCDVSGKGLNAGLISVAVSSMYEVYDFGNGIEELISRINSYIHGLFEGEIFLTGVFIEVNELTGSMDVYDMGHSMAYIVRDEGVISLAGHDDNFPLGIRRELSPVKSHVSLSRGELLLLYSDGFPEQADIAGRAFGEKKILSLAVKYRNSALAQIRDILFDELRSWRIGNAQDDDMSLLMLRFS